MSETNVFDPLERYEWWVLWRRKIYAVVMNFARGTVARFRSLFPTVIHFGGVKVSNRKDHLADETFSALIFGLYERSEFACLPHLAPRHEPVLEFGGSSGVVSCAVSKRLHPPLHVIVEANPKLISILDYHLKLNQAEHCLVLNRVVVADQSQVLTPIRFSDGVGSLAGRVVGAEAQGGTSSVPGVTLNSIYHEQIRDGSFTFICDIEGMEVECLFHPDAREAMSKVSQALIEFHPVERDGKQIPTTESARMFAELTGMRADFRHGDVWVFQSKAAGPRP